jgi:hypothetical protein
MAREILILEFAKKDRGVALHKLSKIQAAVELIDP